MKDKCKIMFYIKNILKKGNGNLKTLLINQHKGYCKRISTKQRNTEKKEHQQVKNYYSKGLDSRIIQKINTRIIL